jgi:hypothetical protein
MKTTKTHWDKIYSTKQPNQVSWTQELPKTSLDFVHTATLTSKPTSLILAGATANWWTTCLTKVLKT